MSTRSMIGVQNKDGSIDAIYCYFDGYLDHNGRILHDAYTNTKKVRGLVKGCAIRFLEDDLTKCEKYADSPSEHFLKTIDFTMAGDIWVEYYYLRVGRKWMYCTCRNKTLKLLTM